MDVLPDTLQHWLREHRAWAPAMVFAITFLESFPGISLLVPATALLLALGAMVGGGLLEPVPVLVAAALGAILGDACGYWAFRWGGKRAVRRWLPRRSRRGYARAMVMFRRWGWAAVFFGRFLGPVRAVAPAAAGVARMPERHFQAANIASAILWAPLMLLPGYAAAQGGEALMRGPEGTVLLGLALVAGLVLVLALRQRTSQPAGSAARAAAPR
ncbi:VTT domain-containing protein [Roseomonas sp. OT10]|uniref:DedA family protein n=1 Tax=Roseomonas cutis TaxID=2897332 RepID=UPI001E63F04F|nr:VTT domain-containing protein [Roseomonas sp. OT10]UFN49004.1 VTT domain-containing protein [Roseomonas sp. OT10]